MSNLALVYWRNSWDVLLLDGRKCAFQKGHARVETRVLKTRACWKNVSGGRGCLEEGRLGVPGQVWEFRFLPSFPSFPRENRSSRSVWETPGSPRPPSSRHPRPSECRRLLEALVDSMSVRLKKRACRKNAFKHSFLQWNAGTACVSECVCVCVCQKPLACRGLRAALLRFPCLIVKRWTMFFGDESWRVEVWASFFDFIGFCRS